ncbi:MAG: T9SS type A sorting domain-containing protein [Flavobacteriales bacterium]
MKKSLLFTAMLAFGITTSAQKPTGSFFEFEFSLGSLANTSTNTSVTALSGTITSSSDRNNTTAHAASSSAPLNGVSSGTSNVINTTLSFWFKKRSNTSSRILQFYGSGGIGYRVHYSTTKVGYEGRVSGGRSVGFNKLTPLSYDTNWHHIVVRTKMGSVGNKFVHELFLDSVKISTTTTTLSGLITNFIKSANFIVNPISDFSGDVDDIYFYKRYLSDAEVGQLYSYNPPINYANLTEKTKPISVTAFPNPATDKVTFNSSENISSIELYSLTGQKVMTKNNSKTLDISSMEKGIYIAKITTKNGSVASKKIIKK